MVELKNLYVQLAAMQETNEQSYVAVTEPWPFDCLAINSDTGA